MIFNEFIHKLNLDSSLLEAISIGYNVLFENYGMHEWLSGSLIGYKVYHGTDVNFDTFDNSKMGEHGSFLGTGFYFSSSKQDASNYGPIIKEAFLRIYRPLNLSKSKQLTTLSNSLPDLHFKNGESVEDCLNKYNKFRLSVKNINIIQEGNGFVGIEYSINGQEKYIPHRSGMGMDTIEALKYIALKEKLDVPNSIIHNAVDIHEFNPSDFTEVVKKAGFDSIIADGTNPADEGFEIVVFNQNQIKFVK